MSAFTNLTRIAGATAVAATTLCLAAGPSSAQTQGAPGSGDDAAPTVRTSSTSGIDWAEVGTGALGGVVLSGGAFAASKALRRRTHQPTPA
jgi:hypothetical protein